jgi:hypothetical protein
VIIGGTALAIGVFGYRFWWSEGFTSEFKTKSEGGFGRNTEFSGIDKLGHGWFNYAAARSLTPAFQCVGNDPETARRPRGAHGLGRHGDGRGPRWLFQDYKFSHEDFIANTIGAWARVPSWRAIPSGIGSSTSASPTSRRTLASSWNPPGDYGGHRYWLMFKADGVKALRDVPHPQVPRGRRRLRRPGRRRPRRVDLPRLRASPARGPVGGEPQLVARDRGRVLRRQALHDDDPACDRSRARPLAAPGHLLPGARSRPAHSPPVCCDFPPKPR